MSQKSPYPSMDRLAELQQMIADFALILRVPLLPGTDRQESDVEHSFGLAITCWYLAPQVAPHLDLSKILRYALAHDFVELHSGDTFAFDTNLLKTKASREADALEKLRRDWSDFPELTEFAEGYAQKHDDEARFVYTIDKFLPSILVTLRGDDTFWTKHKITKEMHEEYQQSKMRAYAELDQLITSLNDWMGLTDDHFYKADQTS